MRWDASVAVLVGVSARIVLGGHWTSQMVSSLLMGTAIASGAQWLLAMRRPASE